MSVESRIQSKVKFSVVIPVFNEEGNLEPLYTRLTKVMKDWGKSYEIIFVQDYLDEAATPQIDALQTHLDKYISSLRGEEVQD